jgi:hypothetical protein
MRAAIYRHVAVVRILNASGTRRHETELRKLTEPHITFKFVHVSML